MKVYKDVTTRESRERYLVSCRETEAQNPQPVFVSRKVRKTRKKRGKHHA